MLRFVAGLTLIWATGVYSGAQPKYESYRIETPCTVHVVRVPRNDRRWELRSVHAFGKALGLENVTAQLKRFSDPEVIPLAGVNGDFYERQGPFAGDPRGWQVLNAELISAPSSGASFWIDSLDQPHIGEIVSKMCVIWPDGSSTPIELNSARRTGEVVLYTSSLGRSTSADGGTELILERNGGLWVPLRPGRVYEARVREIGSGNSSVAPDMLVLSIGPGVAVPQLASGATLKLSTETEPLLRGVRTAISGGPILVKNGRAQRIKTVESGSYVFSSMHERHPRSAVGWNDDFYFLVSVDGRQGATSVGLTLEEFGQELAKLGCEHALNLDGGGSATLWFDGRARNFLCDGFERPVANALAVVERKRPGAK